MPKNRSVTGSITPPTVMNCHPQFGGSIKLDSTPGGGGRTGIFASKELGMPSVLAISVNPISLFISRYSNRSRIQ